MVDELCGSSAKQPETRVANAGARPGACLDRGRSTSASRQRRSREVCDKSWAFDTASMGVDEWLLYSCFFVDTFPVCRPLTRTRSRHRVAELCRSVWRSENGTSQFEELHVSKLRRAVNDNWTCHASSLGHHSRRPASSRRSIAREYPKKSVGRYREGDGV